MSPPVDVGNPRVLELVRQLAEGNDHVERSGLVTEENSVDDFIPIRMLGRGGMGTVLLAVHRKSKKLFAIKATDKAAMQRPRSLQRAQTELQVLASLDHPFFPTLHSQFESTGYRFLVLNYCSGGDLNVLRHKQPERHFSEAAIRFYGAELILALERLHDLGYVYRDLKPENVLLSEGGHVILTDFDLCLKSSGLLRNSVEVDVKKPLKPINRARCPLFCFGKNSAANTVSAMASCLPITCGQNYRGEGKFGRPNYQRRGCTTTKTVKLFVGTEEYVAPELLSGDDYDFMVDWWSFGVLLYELYYGKTPFKGTYRKNTFFNILHNEPEFSGPCSPLQNLIRRLLVKDPKKRLGFYTGAVEIKDHAFFKAVQWDELQNIARPPIVPGLFSAEKLLQRMIDQANSNLEAFLATLERPRKDSAFSSSSDKSDQSSEGDTDSEYSPADQSHRIISEKYERPGE